MLWAIWRHWASYMYNPEFPHPTNVDHFTKSVMTYLQIEFVQRIYEMNPAIQWLEVLEQRSKHNIPEKEFLLIHTKKVRTNPDSLAINEESIHPTIKQWLGNEYLITVDKTYHRPRLRVEYRHWTRYNLPQGAGGTQPPALQGWGVTRPTVVGAGAEDAVAVG